MNRAPSTRGATLLVVTWVVAAANPIAVVVMSDIRISHREGAAAIEIFDFGVKKIHHVAPTVFAGFAGNIVLGFRLIDDLDLYFRDCFDPNISTIALAERWASELPERIQPLLEPSLAHARTDLIIAGMHLAPVISDGIATGECSPYGSGCKLRLHEPAMGVPQTERFSWGNAVSVGSGSAVPAYERMLNEVDWLAFSGWDDPAEVMTAVMNMTIESTPTPGISPELVAMMMKHGPNGITGSGRTCGSMASDRPLMADSEQELRALWDQYNVYGDAVMAHSAVRGP